MTTGDDDFDDDDDFDGDDDLDGDDTGTSTMVISGRTSPTGRRSSPAAVRGEVRRGGRDRGLLPAVEVSWALETFLFYAPEERSLDQANVSED